MNRKLPKYNKLKGTSYKRLNRSAVKLALSICIFLMASLMKLLFPDFVSSVKTDVLGVLNANVDYEKAVSVISDGVSGNKGVKETAGDFVACLMGMDDDVVAVGNMDDGQDSEKDKDETPQEEKKDDEEKKEEDDTTYQEKKESLVSAFKESQSDYSSYELPADTTYEMPDLNIVYMAPAEAAVSSQFGYRDHPVDGEVKFHYGLDLACKLETDVLAFADGEVISVNDSTSYGLNVVISHSNGITTRYAHCSEILVSVGDTVKMGDVIAKSGDTGNATGPCLHFEIRVQDVYVNPEYYLSLV